MNITATMMDPGLFGASFAGATWASWRALLGGFYGEEGVDPDLFHAVTRRAPTVEAFDELWMAIGRRGGKSQAAALIAVYEAAFRDHRPKLAIGEVATVLVVAADRRQARTTHRYVRGLIDACPMLRRMVVRSTDDIIELSNRSAIEIGTASFRALRGYTISCAVLDEIAYWHSDGANPDGETVAGLRPALATLGGKLVALSSPYARRGVLWDQYRRHYGREDPRDLVAQAPSLMMNPVLPPGIVQEALRADPASARAEWLAEFRSDVQDFVSREVVEVCIEPGVRVRPPSSRLKYRAFVDPSGGVTDSMTLAIAHAEGECLVLDCIRERRAPFSPEDVTDDFAAVLREYRVRSVTGDRYGGEWPREAFRRRNIEYRLADRSRSELYRDLLPLLTSGRAALLDDERMIAQLTGLERRTSRGGRDLIDHGPHGQDDVANAVAGVLVQSVAARRNQPAIVPIRGLL